MGICPAPSIWRDVARSTAMSQPWQFNNLTTPIVPASDLKGHTADRSRDIWLAPVFENVGNRPWGHMVGVSAGVLWLDAAGRGDGRDGHHHRFGPAVVGAY